MQHPCSQLDYEKIANTFGLAISGQSEHWDKDMIRLHPEMANAIDEEADEIISSCVDRDMIDEYIESDDPRAKDLIMKWCQIRRHEVQEKMENIPLENGYVRAHRIISCKPGDIRNPLGIFWSHDFKNWPDPTTPWGTNLKGKKTVVIEALVPIEAVNWEYSAMALMSWLLGDCESELRLYQNSPITVEKAWYLESGEKIEMPQLKWRS